MERRSLLAAGKRPLGVSLATIAGTWPDKDSRAGSALKPEVATRRIADTKQVALRIKMTNLIKGPAGKRNGFREFSCAKVFVKRAVSHGFIMRSAVNLRILLR